MYQMRINLGNRYEYVSFYSLWAANQIAKEAATCADVEGVIIINNDTGEIMTEYRYGKLTYISGIGEIN